MKKLTSFILLIGSLQLASYTFGQQVAFEYGASFSPDFTKASIFTNSLKVGYDDDPLAMMSLGFFNTGFDVATQAGLVTDAATLSSFLGNFNLIAEMSFKDVAAPGFLQASGIVNEVGVGSTPYVLTLGGIDSFANNSTATEVGLFTDSGFGTIPAGAEPLPADYNIQTLSFDTVVLGAEFTDQDFSAILGAGMSGNMYATQAVPEPSTYALFLGVFSLGFVFWRKRFARKNAKE